MEETDVKYVRFSYIELFHRIEARTITMEMKLPFPLGWKHQFAPSGCQQHPLAMHLSCVAPGSGWQSTLVSEASQPTYI